MIEVRQPSACPVCGFTEELFAKTFQLGCSGCYTTFAPNLETMLSRLHRGTRHTGKAPGRAAGSAARLRRELTEIEHLLVACQHDSHRVDSLLERWREIRNSLAQHSP